MKPSIQKILFLIFFLSGYGICQSQPQIVFNGVPLTIDQDALPIHISSDDRPIQSMLDFDFEALQSEELDVDEGFIYYSKFFLANEFSGSRDVELVLSFPYILTDVEVFAKSTSDNSFHRTGIFVPIKDRTFSPVLKGNLVKLILGKGEVHEIFFKAKLARKEMVPHFNLKIQNNIQYYNSLINRKVSLSLFAGFLLMMCVYNFFLYFFVKRDTSYIFYSIYLLALVAYSAYNTGDLIDFLVPILCPENPKFMYYGKCVVYFIIFFYLAFLWNFLETSSLLPKWDRVLKWTAYLMLPMMGLDLCLMTIYNFNYNIADFVTVGSTFIFLVVLTGIILKLAMIKHKRGYFIIAGTLLMALGAVATIIGRINTVEYSTLYLRVGIFFEVIIFSLGLAFRRRTIDNENQNFMFEIERQKIVQEQELKEAERLKELDHFKNKLYTNITHEFRTPLTVIMGMNDNIEGHDRETQLIQRNGKQLLRLVNQMLDLSKIESKQMHLKWEKKEVISYLSYLTESFYSLANSKNIRLTFYSEIKELWMDVDDEKLETIVYNLVTNAIKFTKPHGKIVFHVKEIEERGLPKLQMAIQDNGEGISEKDLPHIFDRFYQNKDKIESQGTGIGLALVKEIVSLLEGEIDVQSQSEVGSTFTIKLPIHNNVKRENPSIDLVSQALEGSQSVGSIEYEESVYETEIVLIEDNPDVADYVRSILEKDYKVHVCNNGKSGWEKIKEVIPDVIISDVMMPEMNGYELVKLVKDDERSNHIPVILLTAKATKQAKLEGLGLGADAFLLKPFDKSELLIRVKNMIRHQQSIVQRYQNGGLKNGISTNPTDQGIDGFLQKVWSILDANIEDPDFKAEALSKHLKLSPNQLYRKLKALSGHSPGQFIKKYRLQKAHQMLQSSNFNVSEVAYKVGFTDPSYFTRAFSQEFNKTPSEVLSIKL